MAGAKELNLHIILCVDLADGAVAQLDAGLTHRKGIGIHARRAGALNADLVAVSAEGGDRGVAGVHLNTVIFPVDGVHAGTGGGNDHSIGVHDHGSGGAVLRGVLHLVGIYVETGVRLVEELDLHGLGVDDKIAGKDAVRELYTQVVGLDVLRGRDDGLVTCNDLVKDWAENLYAENWRNTVLCLKFLLEFLGVGLNLQLLPLFANHFLQYAHLQRVERNMSQTDRFRPRRPS